MPRFGWPTSSTTATAGKLQLREHGADELSHYSVGTADIEYAFPFLAEERADRGHRDLAELPRRHPPEPR
ncbi:MAG: hypothetical protein ACKOWG_16790, partial [Planctomycetia bacterium]